jgi:diguanylate cyclase
MVDVGIALFSNLGLLAAIALSYSVVVYYLHGTLRSAIVGLLLGFGAIVSMLDPVKIMPGVIVDARTTMVMLAGFFGGPLAAVITLAIAGAYRIFLGGVGVYAGLISICVSAAIGLACHFAFVSGGRRVMVWHLVFLAVVSPLTSVAYLALPWDVLREVFQKAFVPSSLVRAGGLIFLGIIMLHEQRRIFAEARIRELSYVDELSGLSNRRDFYGNLDREWARWTRYGTPFGLMLIDIDNFKGINDRYGHPAGDEVIRTLARVLKQESRSGDITARIGGEEFVVLLPQMQTANAASTAERMRRAVEAETVEAGCSRIRFTISIGVVGDVSPYPSKEKIMSACDGALYAAKRDGRNRVVSDSPAAVSNPAPGLDFPFGAKPAV